MHKNTNSKLFLRLKAGDKKAFEELFKKHYQAMVLYALNFPIRQEEAEDLVQELFIRFWERKSFFQIETNLQRYLYQTLRNDCINLTENARRKHFEHSVQIPELPMLEPDNSQDEALEKIELAITQLPPKTREIFLRIIYQNQKYKEVAGELNISVNTVKTVLSRALFQLRKEVGDTITLLLILCFFVK